MPCRTVTAAVLIAICAGCGDKESGRSFPAPRPTSIATPDPPAPPPPPPPSTSSPKVIALGETRGHFVGQQLQYEFVAPSAGTLVVRLDYPIVESFLNLYVDGNNLGWALYPPLIWKVPVTLGQVVHVSINPGGTGHEYDDHFVLTLSIE